MQRYFIESNYNQLASISSQNKISDAILERKLSERLSTAHQEIQKNTYSKLNKKFEEKAKVLEAEYKNEINKLNSENQKSIEECKNTISEMQAIIDLNQDRDGKWKDIMINVIQEHYNNIEIDMNCKQNEIVNSMSKLPKIKFIK